MQIRECIYTKTLIVVISKNKMSTEFLLPYLELFG